MFAQFQDEVNVAIGKISRGFTAPADSKHRKSSRDRKSLRGQDPKDRIVIDCLKQIADAEHVLAKARHELSEVLAVKLPDESAPSNKPRSTSIIFGNYEREQDTGAPSLPREVHEEDQEHLVADSALIDTMHAEAMNQSGISLTPRNGWEEDEVDAFLSPVTEKSHWNTPIFVKRSSSRCSCPVLHPESPYMIVWTGFGFAALVYLGFAIPFYIAFDAEPEGIWYFIASVIDVYFITDVIFNFLTATKDGSTLITSPCKITKSYLSRWFLPDVVASITRAWIKVNSHLVSITKSMSFVRHVRLAKFAGLLKMMTAGALKEKIDIYVESSSSLVFITGLGRILMMLFVITHWAACAWFVVGTSTSYTATWVASHVPPDADTLQQYIYSLYFTLTTMTTVGYGDIVAQNYAEVAFGLVLLVIASFVFAGLMGNLTDLITNLNNDKNHMSEKRRVLSQYMHWRNVPHSLFKSVRRHLIFVWTAHEGYDAYEEELKAQLPPVLRKELCFHIYGNLLQTAPFLSWMWSYKACMKDLANMLHTKFLPSGDLLFHIGMPNDKVIMLIKGAVKLTMSEDIVGSIEQADLYQANQNRKQDKPVLHGLNLQADEFRNEMEDQRAKLKHIQRNLGDSYLIEAASRKIELKDQEQSHSAMIIQRCWRGYKVRTKKTDGAFNKIRARRVARVRTAPKTIRPKTVHAPYFFGEACLWLPYEEWTTKPPPTFRYQARCESRVEIIEIPRSLVQAVIERYSPVLRERFEVFRSAIIESYGHRHILDEEAITRSASPATFSREYLRKAPSSSALFKVASDRMSRSSNEWDSISLKETGMYVDRASSNEQGTSSFGNIAKSVFKRMKSSPTKSSSPFTEPLVNSQNL